MIPPSLTPKQHRFIEEFLIDGNKTEALIRAGFSCRGARQYASKLYDKLRQIIEPRLAAQRRALAASSLKTKEERMKELEYAAFLDPAECFDEQGRPLSIREMPESARRAIPGYEVDPDKFVTKVKFVDKRGAIMDYSKLLGDLPDKKQPDPPPAPVKKRDLSKLTDEELETVTRSCKILKRLDELASAPTTPAGPLC